VQQEYKDTEPTAHRPQHSPWLLVTLCAADFLVVLDGLIVAVALPAIGVDLGLSTGGLQWVVTAYVLAFGGLLLLGGRLGDLFGRRRILLVGLVVFAGGSLLAGLAWSSLVLIAGRAVQGVGAAAMAPTALALLVANFAEGRGRDRALGWWSAAGSVGIPAGALLGGLLTAAPGWRAVLLINVPTAILAAVLTRANVPESRDPASGRRLDVAGAVLATGGVSLVVLGVSQVEHAATGSRTPLLVLGPLAAGLTALAAFVSVERRTAEPLLTLSRLTAPELSRAIIAGAALPVGLGAVLFLGTLYLQQVLGLDPLATGTTYLALAVPVIAASPLAAAAVTRLGRRRTAVLGFALQAIGLLLLARVPLDGQLWTDVVPAFVLVGLGAPLAFVPITATAMGAAGGDFGLVSGVFNTSQQVGNALALAAIATLAATLTDVASAAGSSAPLAAGFRGGLLLAAALIAIATFVALRLPARTARQRQGVRSTPEV
jgi:EmrB/QacA subfamily drug resistance transporter